MIKWIKDHKHMQEVQERDRKFLILVFYAKFSSSAKRALAEIEQFSKKNEKVPVYVVDVEKIKGAHKRFGVVNVPTVLSIEKGKVTKRIEGVESSQFYARVFFNAPGVERKRSEGENPHRVVVYTGPGCPACATAKSYLRRRGIGFREVDVAKDSHAAERLVARSGQMAVPQIDIDGHLVVGFDQIKIDRLLSN